MTRWIAFVLVVVVVGTGPVLAAASSPPERHLPRLAWLAGCWASVRGDRVIEEQWMTPRGGTMLGMSRTVTGDATREHESTLIRETDEGLTFRARPSGQAEATFRATVVTDSSVVFENPGHDFPQRISYTLRPDGSLLARIEGERDGTLRGIDFPMARATCADGSGR